MKINIPKDVNEIIHTLQKHGYEAYVVGGCVRDSILNRSIHDWDITTSATPDEMMEVFKDKEIIKTGLQHGTLTIMINGEGYETTTYRIDGKYSDGRRPDNVSFTSDLVEDLRRRDFTMNAIAYNDEVGFVDPYGGLKDIQNEQIKCVGNPEDRFNEDSLRILRLWRFGIQLGFGFDQATYQAAKKLLQTDALKHISYERIQAEFVKALSADKEIFLLQPIEFLEAIIPEWKKTHMKQNNPYHLYSVDYHSLYAYAELTDKADIITRIATLLHDIGKPLCYQDDENGIRHFHGHGKVSAEVTDQIMRRLKFDNETREKVVQLIHYHDSVFEVSDKCVKRWLNKIGPEQFERLLQLRRADIKAQNTLLIDERLEKVNKVNIVFHEILENQKCFSMKDLAINGEDVKNILQINTGKEVGDTLREVLALVIDNKLDNDKEVLTNYLKEKVNDSLECVMEKDIATHIQGIKCDNKKCDFKDMSVPYKDYPKWINKPCPKCGANLLTVHDYKICKTVMALSKLFNNANVPEKEIDTEMHIELNGTDKVAFDIRKTTGEEAQAKLDKINEQKYKDYPMIYEEETIEKE